MESYVVFISIKTFLIKFYALPMVSIDPNREHPLRIAARLCYNFLKGGAVMGRHSDYSI